MKKLILLKCLMMIFFISCKGGNGSNPTTTSFTLESSNFTSGGSIPQSFHNKVGSQCSGDNDFPALSWVNAPEGTKSFVLIVDDKNAGDWVHLNLYDIASTYNSFSELSASGSGDHPAVTFPSGTLGNNSWGRVSWGGPCPPSGNHEYVFTLYALNIDNLPSAINNISAANFKNTYSANILGTATLSGLVAAP